MTILGPILGTELRAVARRARSYRLRSSLAIALSLAVGISFLMVGFATGGWLSIHETALMAEYVFAAIAGIQVVLTVGLVPTLLAGAIAQERERRTLDGLLTTHLSSAQIVLGKLLSGLLQYGSCLLTTLPLAILLCLLGGVDPRLVLLVYEGTASVAFFVAGLSLLVSTSERRASRAVNKTIAVVSAWFILPGVLKVFLPRVFLLGWQWIKGCNEWFEASSPHSVAEALMTSGVGTRLIESIVWMIGLQLTLGCVFVIWSIARLRRCSQGQAEDPGLRRRLSPLWTGLRRRLFGRPPCGSDPVLWKEIHTARMPGLVEILAAIVGLGLVGLIGWGAYYFGRPAFLEQYWAEAVSPRSDAKRTQFNHFLSHTSSWVEFFTLLIVAGIAAGTVTLERAQDTWDSLIASPLSGREILRAKMIATAWKVRWGIGLLVSLWGLGLVAGSVHPLGLGAAVAVLGVSVWFMTAVGTCVSLMSRDSAQASNRALVPALVLSCSFLVCYFPSRYSSVFMGVGSSPFVNWICLVSGGDIREVMSGAATFRRLDQLRITSYDSPLTVLAACLCSIAGFAVGAAWLSGIAFKRFDRVVGRPERASELGARTPQRGADLVVDFGFVRCDQGGGDLVPQGLAVAPPQALDRRANRGDRSADALGQDLTGGRKRYVGQNLLQDLKRPAPSRRRFLVRKTGKSPVKQLERPIPVEEALGAEVVGRLQVIAPFGVDDVERQMVSVSAALASPAMVVTIGQEVTAVHAQQRAESPLALIGRGEQASLEQAAEIVLSEIARVLGRVAA